MTTFSIPGGNLRFQQIETMNELYAKLLSAQWKDKQIWEYIGTDLTAAPCMVGSLYPAAKTKLMIVGRAVNGWQVDLGDCSTLDSTVENVLGQKNRLDDFAKKYTIDDRTGKKYYYARSPFLQLMKKLVTKFEGTDEDWQQKILWSNLYKIAPRDGGNPSWMMIRNDLQTYIELIRREIDFNQPDLVLFVTDENYFDPYPGSPKWPSFLNLFHEEISEQAFGITDLPGCIKHVRAYKGDPYKTIIVCKRPEFRSTDKIVEEVYDMYMKAEGVRKQR